MKKALFNLAFSFVSIVHAGDWKAHWAFQPLRAPPIPEVRDPSWVRTPIDAFILASLEQAGLKPAPPTDRHRFVRRASYNLWGLPATFEEAAGPDQAVEDAFVARLTDRLLDSPRYGERWGRHWLDVARYSDTKGYAYASEQFDFVHAWPYRDWVIKAFNEDMPYDTFILRQLAADRLLERHECEIEDLAAMGFLTLGRRFLGVEQDITDDRIDVTTRGLLGLTASCARCHDHKFDPIPTRDYYALYGVFKSSRERMVAMGDFQDAELKKRRDALEAAFAKAAKEAEARFVDRAGEYLVASLDITNVPKPAFTELSANTDLIPAQIRRWHEFLSQSDLDNHPVFAAWKTLATIEPADFTEEALPGLRDLRARLPGLNPHVWDTLSEPPLQSMQEVAQRYGALLKQARDRKEPEAAWLQVQEVLNVPPVAIPQTHVHDVEWLFDNKANNQLKKLLAQLEKRIVELGPEALHATILEDRPQPVNVRVLTRGDYHQPAEEVPRGFLTALSGPDAKPCKSGSGRLELARAIVHPDNPLTARVMVNRIWQHHFGHGLVRTSSDFGLRSEAPSHPELLDYLALRLIENKGSIKSIHRLILASSVYRQRSIAHAPESDPENRLLSYFPRQRLDFEAMRDSLLAASGELDLRMGGKPGELFGNKPSPRRAVYGRIDRQFLPGALRVFDFANPEAHSGYRHQTSVPQQALFLMNSPFVRDRAGALARRIQQAAPEAAPADRIRRFYQVVYQRDPTPAQLRDSLAFITGETPGEPAKAEDPAPSPWRYGYGEVDVAQGRVKDFKPLPHFTGEAWGGGPKWPDPKLGWVRLTATGGHTGNHLKHAAVRRWISPVEGSIRITGSMRLTEGCGDGVRAMIMHASGMAGTWVAQFGETTPIKLDELPVKQGDIVDFVADCRPSGNFSCDDFSWVPEITLREQVWNAEKDFDGTLTPVRPQDTWERFAQALLLANEFVYVD